MDYTYSIITFSVGGSQVIQRSPDNAFIPLDDDNTDYQAYLAWVADGNTANAVSG